MQDSTVVPWWKESAIYHIYPRSFQDTNGDGVGDLPGIIRRLPYLRDLGVGALWMGPVFRSPQVDNGYDVSDYRDIDPLFGTPTDMDRLIAHAHDLGIRVLLDLVFNHSSNQHRWFQASTTDPDGPYGSYYIWRDPAADGGPPNNWRSFFGGPAWSWESTRGQYYLHLFAPEQPDLNWEHPPVRAALADVARFWLERGVDGFRMDVINMISKRDGLPDLPPNGDLVDIIDEDRVLRYLQEFRAALPEFPELFLVGETPHVSPDFARRVTARETAALDMVLLFDHVEVDNGPGGRWDPVAPDPPRLAGTVAAQQQILAGSSWPSLYLGNHDQPRAVSRFGDARRFRGRSAAALALWFYLHRGTPIVYQGDEIAMANVPLERAADIVDIESANALQELVAAGVAPDEALARVRRRARDNGRTPMQWSADGGAGFTDDGTPWYPPAPDYPDWNVAAQLSATPSDDPQSTGPLPFYRRLLSVRKDRPVLVRGDFLPLITDTAVQAYLRRDGATAVLVIANLSSTATPLAPVLAEALERAPAEAILLSTTPIRAAEAGPEAAMTQAARPSRHLDPWAACALEVPLADADGILQAFDGGE